MKPLIFIISWTMCYLVTLFFFSRKLFRLLLLPHPRCFILSLLIKFAELLRLPIKSLSSQRLDSRSFQELFSEEKKMTVSLIPRKHLLIFPSLKVGHFSKINHCQEGHCGYSQFTMLQSSVWHWGSFPEARIVNQTKWN